jgi:hypothetical protein
VGGGTDGQKWQIEASQVVPDDDSVPSERRTRLDGFFDNPSFSPFVILDQRGWALLRRVADSRQEDFSSGGDKGGVTRFHEEVIECWETGGRGCLQVEHPEAGSSGECGGELSRSLALRKRQGWVEN